MQELEQIAVETNALIAENRAMVVDSTESYRHAGDLTKVALNQLKQLEEARLEMTRPIDKAKAVIMARHKEIAEPLQKFVDGMKQTMLTFARAEQARQAEADRLERERLAAEERLRQKAERERVEAQRKQDEADGIPDLGEPMHKPVESTIAATIPTPPTPKVQDIKTQRGTVATASVKQNWQYEIVDAKAVPRDYCEPSRDHIRQAMAAGVREIPGVRIYDAGNIQIR